MVRSIVKSPPLLLAALAALGLAMAVGLWLPGQAGAQATHTADRSLSATEVMPSAEITVTIEHNQGTGGLQIVETLPDDFDYVPGSATTEDAPRVNGQNLEFTLFAEPDPFTYMVTASPDEGDYTFAGTVNVVGGVANDIGGDTDVTVAADAEPAPTAAPTPGPTVDPSLRGDRGRPGADGAQGEQGPPGEMGEQGEPGPKGDQGPAGPRGAVGLTGPQGPQGPEGPQGPQGPQGNQGIQGNPGSSGDQGPQGNPGNQGAQGPQGNQGPAGERGPEGNPGNQGPAGPAGPDGADGGGGLGLIALIIAIVAVLLAGGGAYMAMNKK